MSTHTRWLTAFLALTLAVTGVASVRGAATPRHTNVVTFNGPVRLPGVTLIAGSYIFERLEPATPDVITVRSRDRGTLHYLGMTVPVARPADLDPNRLVTLAEPTRGAVAAVTAWYPTGEQRGHAFVYDAR